MEYRNDAYDNDDMERTNILKDEENALIPIPIVEIGKSLSHKSHDRKS